jgi:UDP-3-O-[3-hydroxymyristoyl] glucosamine N-acyltransferase
MMKLKELAQAIGAELVGGAGESEVLGVAGLSDAAPGYVSYVVDAPRLAEAEAGPALALIAPPDLDHSSKPLLRAAHPRLAFARALSLFAPAPRLPAGLHSTAQVGEGVHIGEGAAVAAFAVLGRGVKLGRGVQVHPLVVIGDEVEIGEDTVIFPNVTIYDGVRIGARVTIHAGTVIGSAGFGYATAEGRHTYLPHVGTVVVEDDVDIGANCTIDRATTGATVIGTGTKIDNLVHIAHNVTIGRNCLLAGQVGISGSVTLGNGVALAGKVGVADHMRIGDGAIVGGGAAIVTDIPAGRVVYGHPARPKNEQLRIDAAAGRLPELLRTVRELSARIAELEKRVGGEGE